MFAVECIARAAVTEALVIGYGSAGRRHARLLKALGCRVAVVSGMAIDECESFSSIGEALAAHRPHYVVVANETAAHVPTVAVLAAVGFHGRLLVEKPLGGACDAAPFATAAVGYNMRFHPVLTALGEALAGEEAIAAHIYCGQYLPNWRPGTDYRASYSAEAARGGGVLRDLSHELDMLLWLFGDWVRLAAVGGRFGSLDIDSDDCWALLVELERCRCATVQVNYLDRAARRQAIVNTQRHTYIADLVAGTLAVDGEVASFVWTRDETYLAQHRAMLANEMERLCSFAQGTRVMGLIAAAERAAGERRWVRADQWPQHAPLDATTALAS